MSDMKCPLCGSELRVFYGSGEKLFSCSNLSCKAGGFYATDNVWKELISTRKALDLAKDTLHWYNDNYDSVVAKETINEITALEQKEVK
ncbi:hypothetical protein J6W34_01095 [bacterium]|nr:hypothetical protein [bacterium]